MSVSIESPNGEDPKCEARSIPESGVIFFVKIEKCVYEVTKSFITGRELLELNGKAPGEYHLFQKFSDGKKVLIEESQNVDLSVDGIEKFFAMPKKNVDGLEGGQRDFPLPPLDEEALSRLGLKWATISLQGQNRIVIYQWPLPAGYNVTNADISLQILSGYPEVQIDMASFSPPLSRLDGKSIPAATLFDFNGKQWQQWSRHRTPENPWRVGVDDVETHLAYVTNWLSQELKRG